MPRAISLRPVLERREAADFDSVRVGEVLGWCPDGRLLVDFPGNGPDPVPADVTASWDATSINRAIRDALPALIAFDGGNREAPLVVGFLRQRKPIACEEEMAAPPGFSIDGKSVVFEGKNRIVLRAGEAEIVLTSDGHIQIKGENILTSSRGVHRIRGGSVQIN